MVACHLAWLSRLPGGGCLSVEELEASSGCRQGRPRAAQKGMSAAPTSDR